MVATAAKLPFYYSEIFPPLTRTVFGLGLLLSLASGVVREAGLIWVNLSLSS